MPHHALGRKGIKFTDFIHRGKMQLFKSLWGKKQSFECILCYILPYIISCFPLKRDLDNSWKQNFYFVLFSLPVLWTAGHILQAALAMALQFLAWCMSQSLHPSSKCRPVALKTALENLEEKNEGIFRFQLIAGNLGNRHLRVIYYQQCMAGINHTYSSS